MRRAALGIGMAIALASTAARAQVVCPPAPALEPFGASSGASGSPETGALALVDRGARMRFLERTMREDAARARAWSLAWAIAGVALVAGNATYAALTTNADDRVDAIVAASTSLFIPATLIVHPLRVMGDAPRVSELAAFFGDGHGGIVACAPLARAEELLVRDASDEALGTSWLAHTVTIGGNLAIAAVLGFGLGHWKGAALQGLGGIAVGETHILTQPTGALEALRAYERGKVDLALAPMVVPDLAGQPSIGVGFTMTE